MSYNDVNTKTEQEEKLFAVYRSGIRVSDSVYPSDRDPSALNEKRYWENILKRYPDGTKISIREIRYRR